MNDRCAGHHGTPRVLRLQILDRFKAVDGRIHRVANTAGQIGDELETLDRQRAAAMEGAELVGYGAA